MLSFSEALTLLKRGRCVARAGWNGRGMHIALQLPNRLSMMTLPYLYMRTVEGHLVPWLASQTDILSSDWEEVRPPSMGAGCDLSVEQQKDAEGRRR